jgi:hypothetical protein
MSTIIEYAVEIETRTTITAFAYGLTHGFFRFITGRPNYTTSVGDSAAFAVTVDGTETLDYSTHAGQLYGASNPPFKTAATVPDIGMVFACLGTTDFTEGELVAAKGSALVANDLFRVTNNVECAVVEYVGSNLWHKDYIVKNGLGSPSRSTGSGIEKTGDYGTLSGFDFTIKNTNKVWKYLDDNQIYIVNKEIRLYAVIDEVFFQIWDGVVKNIKRTDTTYTFQCADAFRKVHKTFPPNKISATEFPNVNEKFIGEALPVAVGDIPYNRILAMSQSVTVADLVGVEEYWSDGDVDPYFFEDSIFIVAGGTGGKPTIMCRGLIEIPDLDIAYVKVIQGLGLDTDILYKVLNYGITTYKGSTYTVLVLDQPLQGLANQNWGYFHMAVAFNLSHVEALLAECFIEVISIDYSHIVSDRTIKAFQGNNDKPLLLNWNKDIEDYQDVSSIVISSSTSDTGDIAHPHINTIGRSVTDDELVFLSPIIPATVNWQDVVCLAIHTTEEIVPAQGAWKDTASNMVDLSRVSSCNICASENFFGKALNPDWYWLQVYIDIDTPPELLDENVEKMYMMFDWEYELDDSLTSPEYYEYKVAGIDRYGRVFEKGETESIATFKWRDSDVPEFSGTHRHLPNAYYLSGNDGGETSTWGIIEQSSVAGAWAEANNVEILELDNPVDIIRSGVAVKLRLTLSFGCRIGWVRFTSLKINQLGFIGASKIALTGKDLYTRVKGEYSSAYTTESNNVYRAYQLMLEKYDEIASTRINYGNLIDERSDWHVGRQISKQEKTFDYIKDLCKQSFVCLTPSRTGKRLLGAWLDKTDTDATFDNSTIIDGSIKNMKLTPISSLFNSFDIQYGWNPGQDKYDKIFFIHKVEEDLDDLPADFSEYVGGLDSYPDANLLWKACRHAYEQAEVLQPAPNDLSEMNWYIDYNKFAETRAYTGTNSSAYKFLFDFVMWTTRQKGMITFSIPMSATNVYRELLDYISFTDSVYTDSVEWLGWIRKIKYNLKKDLIEITLIFRPRDEFETGLIIERGDMGDPTITERGDEGDDTITEGGA